MLDIKFGYAGNVAGLINREGRKMTKKLKKCTIKTWRLFLPILYFRFQIPLFEIRTGLMSEFIPFEREYISVFVRFWKWKFDFTLYDTMRRKVMRQKDD